MDIQTIETIRKGISRRERSTGPVTKSNLEANVRAILKFLIYMKLS